jgi:quinoprotein glucose dehydrogenase
MDWLDEELAVKTVEERVAYMTRHEGKRIAEYTNHSDRVRLLWDSDGDGRADKSVVFADGFNGIADGIGAGLLARRGEVYYANIPSLWKFKTPDAGTANPALSGRLPWTPQGANRGSNVVNLATGFGIRVGFLGHDLHGLRFGPDGKLYFSIGDRGAHVINKEGKLIENRETGAVYRCDPDGANLEIYATGLRNPQELVFDAFGNLWTGDNNSDGGDPARWVYVVEGGDSGWRVGYQFITQPNSRGPWLAERMCYPQFDGQAAFLLPPLANIGNGPSGLAFHPGSTLNDHYQDHFFLCDFRGGTGSGIHSFAVKPRGAGFEVTDRAEFLWDMLVTDCEFGYDGCLYVSDWVNGWNQTGKGRIYRVFDPDTRTNSLVNQVKILMAAGFVQRSNLELSSALDFPDQRIRQEAQFELATRGEPAIATFVGVLQRSGEGGWVPTTVFNQVARLAESRLARLHAIWGLGQIAASKTQSPAAAKAIDALLPFASDADSEIRAQTAKVLGDVRARAAYEPLLKLLSNADPRPRYFAGIALARLGRPEALPAFLEMLRSNDNQDRYLRHAGVMGLTALADGATLKALASNSSIGVRLAAVVALRRQERPEVAAFLSDSEPAVVLEAARAIHDVPISTALPALAGLLTDAEVLGRQQFGSQQQRKRAATTKNAANPKPDDEPDVLFAPLLRRIVNARFRLGTPADANALVAFATSGIGPRRGNHGARRVAETVRSRQRHRIMAADRKARCRGRGAGREGKN